jgi:hypothetical protein
MQDVMRDHNPVDWSAVLRVVREAAPADVCITELGSDDSRNLSLRGLARSYEAAQAFAQGLKGRDFFEAISLEKVGTQPDARSLIRYEIDCLLPITR